MSNGGVGQYAGGKECPECGESVWVTDHYCRKCGEQLRTGNKLGGDDSDE